MFVGYIALVTYYRTYAETQGQMFFFSLIKTKTKQKTYGK